MWEKLMYLENDAYFKQSLYKKVALFLDNPAFVKVLRIKIETPCRFLVIEPTSQMLWQVEHDK